MKKMLIVLGIFDLVCFMITVIGLLVSVHVGNNPYMANEMFIILTVFMMLVNLLFLVIIRPYWR